MNETMGSNKFGASDDENEDSGVEEEPFDQNQSLQTPELPPVKPRNETLFYIDENQERLMSEIPGMSISEVNAYLRREWKETLGKQEKQKWKRKYKLARQQFEQLLALYQAAHPHFDAETHYAQQDKQTSATTKKKRNKRRMNQNESFTIQTFDSDGEMNSNDAQLRKKRKLNNRHRNSNSNSNQSQQSMSKIFDKALSDINSKRRRRPQEDKFVVSDTQLALMKQFVSEMRHAARNDWSANRKQKPTITMIKKLDSVVEELSKKLLHSAYLNHCDVLDAIRDWIHPLPDGSLPPLKIRTEMYRVIDKLRLHADIDINNYLQRSEDRTRMDNQEPDDDDFDGPRFPVRPFAKTMMYLWSHKQETPENKALLRKIMERWIRSLTQTNTSYGELRSEMEMQQQSIVERNRVLKGQQRQFDNGTSKRARVPQAAWHDFVVQPRSNVHEDDSSNRRRSLFSARLKNAGRKSNSKQATKVSITGRASQR